ncbi:MAG: F0F1 ATP synthase subunit B [Flavobacterium piscis]|nr:F0F1 ATP synthase subunit B [Flavobacterium piscis]
MDLVTPGIGLIFWTGIIFLTLLFILTKVAWKPINKMIENRNQSIEDALKMAEKAREEMKQLQAENEKILSDARAERDKILKEARDMKEQIVAQAKEEAVKEMERIRKNVGMEIEAQKAAAIEEMKNTIVDLSIEVAKKVIRKELKSDNEHQQLVESMLKDIKFN